MPTPIFYNEIKSLPKKGRLNYYSLNLNEPEIKVAPTHPPLVRGGVNEVDGGVVNKRSIH